MQRLRGSDVTAAGQLVASAPHYPKFVFGIFSGRVTAQSRVPVQLVTWLRDVQNFVIIGAEGTPWPPPSLDLPPPFTTAPAACALAAIQTV